MKKLTLVFSIAILFLLSACNFNTRNNDVFVNVSAVVENKSRTALPELRVDLLKNISLLGKYNGESEFKSLSTWSNYEDFNSDSIVRIKSGDWVFKLSAEIGGYRFEAENPVTISQMNTDISFSLAIVDFVASEVPGAITVLLTYPNSVSNERVKVVTGQLYSYVEGDIGTAVTTEMNASTYDISVDTKTVVYNLDSVAPGNYFVKLRLYADTSKTLLLNDLEELAVVNSDGIISSSAITIPVLDDVYSVSIYDGETLRDTLYYTKRSGITLPVIYEKEGFCLNGFKEDLTDDDYVTEILTGTTGNKVLYIDWETGVSYKVIVRTQNLDGETYTETEETKWGRNGSNWTIPLASRDGFTVTANSESILLNSDSEEEQEVIITYNRQEIKWSYKLNSTDVSDYYSITKLYGTSVNIDDRPADPTTTDKPGYHFEEWISPVDFPEEYPVTYTNNYDFVAKSHSIRNYTVYFHVPEGVEAIDSLGFVCEEGVVLPTPDNYTDSDYVEYEFVCWKDSEDNIISNGDTLSSNVTLTAYYEEVISEIYGTPRVDNNEAGSDISKYQITYSVSSGADDYYITLQSGYTCYVEWIDSCTNSSYLSGLYTLRDKYIYVYDPYGNQVYYRDDGNGEFNPSVTGTYNVRIVNRGSGAGYSAFHLYQNLPDTESVYKIRYVSTYEKPSTKVVYSNTPLDSTLLPRLTREGYRFKGWYLDAEYSVVASIGTEVTDNLMLYAKWEVFEGVDYSDARVGDIVLADGSYVSPSDFNVYSMEAIAVIFREYDVETGKPALGLGTTLNVGGGYMWCSSTSNSYSSSLTEILGSVSSTSFYLSSTTYGGDLDGSDNWEYICSIDSLGTSNPSTYYPVFNYVLNYASSNNLSEDFSNGWYLPAFAELVDIKRNRSTVNSSLQIAGVSTIFGTGQWYWSSNSYSSTSVLELNIMEDGRNCAISKTSSGSDMCICVIRKFE